MFLKSLELRGFKSFADKTELSFNEGITAIVGPNGSGKSNISDAVKWVLGEQSAKSMRGGKMEDVIFIGTDFRKPLGLCQVSLTLDNSDLELPLEYSDITVSRRLYRSGESEYYINNTQCRLKDIQELFMDTGIGKEGYSIIGQGKIEAILSGKAEDRRSLLEEAAGIVKFKTRKEEAQKKLQNTEQNLLRINDILSTFEERLEPLRIESEKAKAFLDISEKLKKKEINLIIHSIEEVQKNINEQDLNLESLEKEYEELKNQLQSYKFEFQSSNRNLEDFEKEASNKMNYYYNLKSKLQDIEKNIALSRERIENFKILTEKNKVELNNALGKINELENLKLKYENELKEKQECQLSLNNDIQQKEELRKSLSEELSKREFVIKDLKNDQIEYLSLSANLKNEINNVTNNIDVFNKKLEQLKGSNEGIINSLNINVNTKNALQNQIAQVKEQIKEFEKKISENKKRISESTNNVLQNEKKFRELNNNYSKLNANHNMLVNLDKQYEGYNKSVKMLMQDINREKISGVKSKCCVLGEIIDVPKELETAIEISLGGAISDIITEEENTAKVLINYLKNNKLGRATFLPLSIIKGKKVSLSNNITKMKGYIGIASELINYDSKYAPAIEYVIGRTLICSDMDEALNIAKAANYSYKIVTLSGEVVNVGGALTGGSIISRTANIISRKREIEELAVQIENINLQIEKLVFLIQQEKDYVKELDNSNLTLKEEIYSKNIDITKIEGKVTAIDEENNKLKNNYKIYNTEMENINSSLLELNKELAQKSSKIEDLKYKQSNNEGEINEIEEFIKNNGVVFEELREDLTQLRIKKAQIDEVVSNLIKELTRLDNQIEELNKSIINYKNDIFSISNNEKEENKKIEDNLNDLSKSKEELLSIEDNFKNLEVTRTELKNIIELHRGRIENINLEISNKESAIHRLQLQKTKLDTEKESLYNRLNDELSLTYAEALEYKDDIENMDDYKKQIVYLKGEISKLGVVNVGAIQEYSDVKEKHNFMSTQKDDLIKSKEDLENMIKELTSNMQNVFVENFNKLRELFNETFRELFKGGSADLILDYENILNGNIEIHVQPPGKRVQNINLMSGGEKGLSAIALLFAILKMKPTPFCIVDEIEAALDDANVSRFAEFLRRFSNKIQFVVITHRKGTMESADALYGVTMEEKGISKIVSVNLNKQFA